MDDQQDFVKDFLVESYENLDQLDSDLVQLEQDPASAAQLSSIFRTMHTFKGTCSFLGFPKLQGVAHVGENLLSKLRDRELTLRPEITTGLLRLVDAIREILGNIESIGSEGEADYTDLLRALARLELAPHDPTVVDSQGTELRRGIEFYAVTSANSHVRANGATGRTVRVKVELLDQITDRIGELVLARDQILRRASELTDAALSRAVHALSSVTSELKEAANKITLQPIANLWERFPRFVRELAQQCGKQVRFETEGCETELDRTILEAIKDPLTHLVHNAIDHGIEPPQDRQLAGKPAQGLLVLAAVHRGDQVEIEIRDDGRGVDPFKVRCKAVECGILTPEQAGQLSDHDAARLIFLPGFSTAQTITRISGRGVGMDVVMTNLVRIGGAVDIDSRLGHGTTIRLTIPLALDVTKHNQPVTVSRDDFSNGRSESKACNE